MVLLGDIVQQGTATAAGQLLASSAAGWLFILLERSCVNQCHTYKMAF